jgi:hypothetical protein
MTKTIFSKKFLLTKSSNNAKNGETSWFCPNWFAPEGAGERYYTIHQYNITGQKQNDKSSYQEEKRRIEFNVIATVHYTVIRYKAM